MEHPGTSMFQYFEGLLLVTSVQRLEEDEAEEDKKHRNKQVLQSVPWSVCVRHTDIIKYLLLFSAPNFMQFTSTLCYI